MIRGFFLFWLFKEPDFRESQAIPITYVLLSFSTHAVIILHYRLEKRRRGQPREIKKEEVDAYSASGHEFPG